MESLIPIFAGGFMKLVDEMEDAHILEEYKEYAQTLCTLFISLWFYSNVYISLLFILCVIPACYFVKQIDTVYWKTLIPIPFIIFLLKMDTLEYIDTYDIVQRALTMIIIFILIFVEAKVNPEETSLRKIVCRVFYIILGFAVIYLTSELSSAAFIQSFTLYVMGYYSVSVISKTLFTQIPEASSDSHQPKPI